MVYILENKDYYNASPADANSIAADSVTYAGAISIPLVLVAGFFYDIFGRGLTIVLTMILGALATFFVPFVSPSIVGYDICRVIFSCTLIIMLSNPFINDYVQVECRGVATGFQTIGQTLGNLASVALLFTLTEKHMTNKKLSYSVMSVIMLIEAGLLWWMIDEPSVMSDAEERHQKRKTLWGRLWSLLKLAYKACKQDPALSLALLASFFTRSSSQLTQVNFQIWVASFNLDSKTTLSIWQTQNLISSICALPLVFLTGRVADSVSPKIMTPLVIIFQMLVMLAYYFIKNPESSFAYFLSAFQAGSGFMLIVVI